MKNWFGKCCGVIICLMMIMGVAGWTTEKELLESDLPDHLVFRPAYETLEGELNAGTAFAIRMEGSERLVVLTAMHIFGPAGGLEKQVSDRELTYFVQGVHLFNLFDDTYYGSTNQVLLLLGTEPLEVTYGSKEENYAPKLTVYHDLAAFVVPTEVQINGVKLATTQPMVGEPVWLLASIIGGNGKEKLYKGYVETADARQLIFRYENPDLNLRATSGAPIFNQHGEVVGLNIGASSSEGNLYGYANPAPSIQNYLSQAVFY